jgi:hypothetical protein
MLAYLTSLLLFKYASCGLVSFMHMKCFFLFFSILKHPLKQKLEILNFWGYMNKAKAKKINHSFLMKKKFI